MMDSAYHCLGSHHFDKASLQFIRSKAEWVSYLGFYLRDVPEHHVNPVECLFVLLSCFPLHNRSWPFPGSMWLAALLGDVSSQAPGGQVNRKTESEPWRWLGLAFVVQAGQRSPRKEVHLHFFVHRSRHHAKYFIYIVPSNSLLIYEKDSLINSTLIMSNIKIVKPKVR